MIYYILVIHTHCSYVVNTTQLSNQLHYSTVVTKGQFLFSAYLLHKQHNNILSLQLGSGITQYIDCNICIFTYHYFLLRTTDDCPFVRTVTAELR